MPEDIGDPEGLVLLKTFQKFVAGRKFETVETVESGGGYFS